MDYFIILLYLLLIIPHFSSAASNDCPSSYCGQSFNRVRFPFRLIDQQHVNCGFPGFDLNCVSPSTLLINLPGSGHFGVRSIDYHSQAIRIFDHLNCLPARLATFDLSNSPFSASYYRNYTLLTCPNGVRLFGFKPIDCLSNSSFSVLATDSLSLVTSMTSNQSGCVTTGVLRVPMENQPDQDGFTSQLDDDITLTWGTPDCESCEGAGVSCGYANRSTQMTTCFYDGNIVSLICLALLN